jgi:uncharacterized protein
MISSLDDPRHCGGSRYRMPVLGATNKAHSVEPALHARPDRAIAVVPGRLSWDMTCSEAIDRLRTHADAIKAMGATSLYLYGSTARDEAGAASDLEIFIDYDSRGKFNLLDLDDIKLLLEQELDLAVDVTRRSSLHPMLKTDIEKTAVRVF